MCTYYLQQWRKTYVVNNCFILKYSPSTDRLDTHVHWVLPGAQKAGLKKWTAVVPFLAERELSTVLFKRMRTFYRSFAIAAILMLGAIYLGPKESKGWMFTNIAAIVYEYYTAFSFDL